MGAAIALAFVGAGAVVLLALKTKAPESAVTVIGLGLAAAVTLTGAFGELLVVFMTGQALDLGGFEDWLWVPSLLIAVLLGVYALRTLADTIIKGSTAPPPAPEPDAIVAARLIAVALQAHNQVDSDAVEAAIEGLPVYPVGPSPGDTRSRRRGALL